jgi:hypothetical protein
MQIFTILVFGNGRYVRIESDVRPPLVEEINGLHRSTWRTYVECSRKYLALGRVGKEIQKRLVSMFDFAIVCHAGRVSHPKSLSANDFQRVIGRCVMDEPFGFGVMVVTLLSRMRHENALELHAKDHLGRKVVRSRYVTDHREST